jgi:hypothetical protein
LYKLVLSPDVPVNNKQTTNDMELRMNYLKEENGKLLQLAEVSQYEEKQAKSAYSDLKDKYCKLLDDNDKLNDGYNKYKKEYEELFAAKKYVEDKIKENTNKMIMNDKKLGETIQSSEKWEIENRYLKQEVSNFKELYNDLEFRKNSEIDLLMRDIQSNKLKENELKNKVAYLEEENAEVRFENNKLKQENYISNLDCEHLGKLVEESNFAVKSAEEKEKHIDSIIKQHKKKAEEAILEKEKSLMKQKLMEKQIAKITEDFSKLLSDKQNQYEQFIDSTKSNFDTIVNKKEDEVSMLKTDNISLRIEKDKYMSEYKSIKSEYDKLFYNYREDNEKYIKKFEESEKTGFRIQSGLQEKLNNLTRKVEQLEYEKAVVEQELTIYKSNDKSKDQLLERTNKNEEFFEKEVFRLREKLEAMSKEKEGYQKESEKKSVQFDNKLKQLKEQYELKVSILENAIRYQKEQFSVTEDKALSMLKRHENVFSLLII